MELWLPTPMNPDFKCILLELRKREDLLSCKESEAFTLEPKKPHGNEYKLHWNKVDYALYIPPNVPKNNLDYKHCYEWTDQFANCKVAKKGEQGRDQLDNDDKPVDGIRG